MAIAVTLNETQIGVAVPDAYVRVRHVDGDKNRLFVRLAAYVNEDARRSGASEIAHFVVDVDPSIITGELFPSLYDAVKSDPMFADAVDV